MFNLVMTTGKFGASADFHREATVILEAIKICKTIVLYKVGYLSRSIPNNALVGVSLVRLPVRLAIKDEIEFQTLFRVLQLQSVCRWFPVCSLHFQQMSDAVGYILDNLYGVKYHLLFFGHYPSVQCKRMTYLLFEML